MTCADDAFSVEPVLSLLNHRPTIWLSNRAAAKVVAVAATVSP